MPDEPIYTPKQAAAYLGVSDQTIYNPASEVERVKRKENDEGHDDGLAVAA